MLPSHLLSDLNQSRIRWDFGCLFLQMFQLCPQLSPPELPGVQQLSVGWQLLCCPAPPGSPNIAFSKTSEYFHIQLSD